ncbi:MAG: carbon storage regulator CsrA [Planctomycetes bacterium]|nr:carbon storage regulator CsrA [Planctomycetota bacterium]
MLVLSRQRDETIMIGDNIEITVVDIRGEKVRLGINAPPHVAVHRKEVYLAIKREHQAAGKTDLETPVESLAKRKDRNGTNGGNSHDKPAAPPGDPNAANGNK